MKLDASTLRDWLDRLNDLLVHEYSKAEHDELYRQIEEAWRDAIDEEARG